MRKKKVISIQYDLYFVSDTNLHIIPPLTFVTYLMEG